MPTEPTAPSRPNPGITSPLPHFQGRTVAETIAGLEAAGATLVIFDARWDRPVAPDWVVCTDDEIFNGDFKPTGQVHIAAVPAGDPCP